MNRFFGTLFALATLGAIAFAILNSGNYTSMLSARNVEPAEVVDIEPLIVDQEPIYEDAMPVDSLINEPIPEPIE